MKIITTLDASSEAARGDSPHQTAMRELQIKHSFHSILKRQKYHKPAALVTLKEDRNVISQQSLVSESSATAADAVVVTRTLCADKMKMKPTK